MDQAIAAEMRRHHVFGGAAGARGLEITAKADAAQPAAGLAGGAARREAGVVRLLQGLVHDRGEFAAVVDRAVGRGVGEGAGRDEIAPAQGHRIEPVFGRGLVHQALDHVGDVWPPGAAIGRDRHRVGEHQRGARVQRRHPVDPAHRHRDVLGADHRLEVDGVGAQVGLILESEGQDGVVVGQGNAGLERERAAVPVAQEDLGARAHPFHRPAELARGQHHQDVFGIGSAAQAERAAHILGDHFDAAGVEAGDRGQRRAHAQHALGGGVQGEVLAGGVVGRQAGARLHRGADQALAVHPQRGGAGSLGEGGIDSGTVAGFEDQADVARMAVVQLRCAGGEGSVERGDRGQLFVVDLDELGGILGGQRGVGDDHRDRLTDETHAIGGEHGQRPLGLRLAVGADQRGARRDLVKARFGDIPGGEHRDHAGGGTGRGGVDLDQPRVRAVGADHEGMQLAAQIPVGGVFALAGDQAEAFMAGGDQIAGPRVDDGAHVRSP